MKTNKVNGIIIRYLEIPNKGKETIIFLHYGGATLAVWNGMIPYFKNDFHIIASDLRGHGLSEQPESGYHIDIMAQDVAELMDYLGVESAFVVGSSLGADVAVSLAANHPEKVNAAILDGGFSDIVGPDSKDRIITEEEITEEIAKLKGMIFSREQQFFNSKEEAVAYYKERWEKLTTQSDAIKLVVEDNLKETNNGKFTSNQSREVVWKYIEPLYDVRFEDYYQKVNCPVFFLPDEKEIDHEIVQKNLEKYRGFLKHSKVKVIDGSIHAYTCLLKPKEMSDEILEFIEEIK